MKTTIAALAMLLATTAHAQSVAVRLDKPKFQYDGETLSFVENLTNIGSARAIGLV